MENIWKVSLLVGLMLSAGCDFNSRSDAVRNTEYASDLARNGVTASEKLALGMGAQEVLKIMGDPLWIRDVTSEQKPTWNPPDFSSLDLSTGSWRLWYSKQKNPTLDFIRVTVAIEDNRITEIEDQWYHE